MWLILTNFLDSSGFSADLTQIVKSTLSWLPPVETITEN